MRPLLLIDVDGVLCPYFTGDPHPGFERLDAGVVAVWVCPRHGEWLNTLAGWYDLVWATTWESDAARLLAPVLGLPDMPAIEFVSPVVTETWKLHDVSIYVGDRALAWIDDELGSDVDEWADARPHASLLVRVDGTVGFTEAHYEAVLRFGIDMTEGSA